MTTAPIAIQQVSDALAAQGYRWQPPPPLTPSARPGLFASHLVSSWIDPLLTSLSHSRGGVYTLRWSIEARQVHSVPAAMPPSAQRVLSAVWAGARPFHVPIAEMASALAQAGVDSNDLAFVVSTRPSDADPLHQALGHLGVGANRIGFDWYSVATMKRAMLTAGQQLSIEFPVGAPCSSSCGPGCRCGRYLVLARLQFSRASPVRSLLEVAVLESELLSVLDDTREPFGVRRFATLVKSVHEVLASRDTRTAHDQRVRVLVDRAFTVALLIGSGFLPGPRGHAHVVRRLLRQAGTELVLTGASLTQLKSLVQVADESVRAQLGFTPLSDYLLETVKEEQDRFSRVLARAPILLENVMARHQHPLDRAHFLLRLRSERGVPLAIAMAWCQENDFTISLKQLARLDGNHPPGNEEHRLDWRPVDAAGRGADRTAPPSG